MCDDVNERRVPFHTLRQCVSERGFSACFPIQRRRHHHPQRQDATSTSNNGNILSTKSHRWDVHLQKNTQKCRDLLMCLRPPHPKLSQFISFPPTHCHRIEATRAGSIRWRRELDKKKIGIRAHLPYFLVNLLLIKLVLSSSLLIAPLFFDQNLKYFGIRITSSKIFQSSS